MPTAYAGPSADSAPQVADRDERPERLPLTQRLQMRLRRELRTHRRLLGPAFRPNLWRVDPVSREFGFDRGMPIDRYFIEKFLGDNAALIRGRVLEIEHDLYASKFGGAKVDRCDILYRDPGLERATIIADLADAPNIPDESFDCVILIHTLQYIYDTAAAIRTCRRILKPGGSVLAASLFIGQYSPGDRELWGEYWRFSRMAFNRLFGEVFGSANVRVEAFGNALTAAAFIQGVAAEELSREELDHYDPNYDVAVAAVATRRD
jgi:SAM-dependent methyltransferase